MTERIFSKSAKVDSSKLYFSTLTVLSRILTRGLLRLLARLLRNESPDSPFFHKIAVALASVATMPKPNLKVGPIRFAMHPSLSFLTIGLFSRDFSRKFECFYRVLAHPVYRSPTFARSKRDSRLFAFLFFFLLGRQTVNAPRSHWSFDQFQCKRDYDTYFRKQRNRDKNKLRAFYRVNYTIARYHKLSPHK